jgi:hypothetical protein
MDPNANLKEQRHLVSEIQNPRTSAKQRKEHTYRLAELSEAMDEWLSNGGFLPKAWSR